MHARITQVVGALLNEGFSSIVQETPLKQYAPWHARILLSHPKNPTLSLSRALQTLGGGFIPLAHVLSTLSGETTFKNVQDKTAIPHSYVIAAVQREHGAAHVKTLDASPTHVDSLTQTHTCTLTDGTRAAITIIKPNAEHAILRDVPVVRWLANALDTHPYISLLKPRMIARTFEEHVKRELDLRTKLSPGSPSLHRQLTTRRVLLSHPLDAAVRSTGTTRDELAIPALVQRRIRDGNVRVEM